MTTVSAEIDSATLSAYLNAECPGLLNGELTIDLIAGGRSNLTYRFTDGHNRWVLRRPPLGHVLDSAHDVGREFRVMKALADSAVPVPQMVVHCTDASVIGAPFYIMDFADGDILRDASDLEGIDKAHATTIADSLVDTLVALHGVDPAAVGLENLGRPEGYLARQVKRWVAQLGQSRSRDVPELDRLATRLAQTVPASGPVGIVHGDYRLDNCVLNASGRGVAAVLDWEMATIGDTLTDLAWLALWWDGLAGLDSPIAAVPGEFAGFPPSSYLVDCYVEATNTDAVQLGWYLGFAAFKSAVLFEGIHYRHEQGLTVGEGFDRIGSLVAPTTERGHAALAEAGL